MMIRFCIATCLLFVQVFGYSAFAATSEFRIRTLIGGDVTPPTTPSIISAIPVSQTQINITWSASTDNFSFGGYQVYRDAMQVATTTLTSYSDTGLTASTTYSYTIRAFDSALNYSSTSAAVATTTFATSTPTTTPPVVPVATTATTSDRGQPSGTFVLRDLTVELSVTRNTATFLWQTPFQTGYQLRWGRTTEYELGTVVSQTRRSSHQTSITGLDPGTTYEYELVAYTASGRQEVTERGRFTTEAGPDITPPANVRNLEAERTERGVVLRWDDPFDPDFASVRVLRNYRFFPNDPNDGLLIYQGSGNEVVDVTAAENATEYYTVFAYDATGNVSSGAVVAVYSESDSAGTPPEIIEVGEYQASSSALLPPGGDIVPQVLELGDITVEQDGRVTTLDQSVVTIDASKPLTFSIDYEQLPEHLKSIVVTLAHPDNTAKTLSFLLRINADKTKYEATVSPLAFSGMMPFRLAVYDFKTQQVFELARDIEVELSAEESTSVFGGSVFHPAILVAAFILILLFCYSVLRLLLIISRHARS